MPNPRQYVGDPRNPQPLRLSRARNSRSTNPRRNNDDPALDEEFQRLSLIRSTARPRPPPTPFPRQNDDNRALNEEFQRLSRIRSTAARPLPPPTPFPSTSRCSTTANDPRNFSLGMAGWQVVRGSEVPPHPSESQDGSNEALANDGGDASENTQNRSRLDTPHPTTYETPVPPTHPARYDFQDDIDFYQAFPRARQVVGGERLSDGNTEASSRESDEEFEQEDDSQHYINEMTDEDIEDIDDEDVGPRPAATGTTSEIISRMRVVFMDKTSNQAAGHDAFRRQQLEEGICPISYDPLINPASLDTCGHVLCADCLANWASRANTCPFCREEFEEDDMVLLFCRTPAERRVEENAAKKRREDADDRALGVV